MATAPVDYGGGSGFFKGKLLADLVVSEGLATVVEIGIHHGRSLLEIRCERRAAAVSLDVDPEEVRRQGHPDLGRCLVPEGWLVDPQGVNQVVCGDCASAAEIVAWMEKMELVEELMREWAP